MTRPPDSLLGDEAGPGARRHASPLWRRLDHPLVRYGVVGVGSFAIDFGALYLGYTHLGLPLWVATSAGFWLSFVVNFAANRYWTFAVTHRSHGQLVRYSVLVAVNYLATVGIVAGLHALGVGYVAAKAVAVVLLTATTYLAYRTWVFPSPTVRPVNPPSCCVCDSPMKQKLSSWCFRCPQCGTWASDLPMGINSDAHLGLDEDLREVGLADLRRHNHGVVADRLVAHGLRPGGRLLDVGSAHGWFLRAARERGLEAQGIEPDEAVAARAEDASVRVGFFPDVLGEDERFDAITYNDVLEHFPDAGAAVAASSAHLVPGGLLSVNIPNSRGLFYRLATLCYALGLRSAFDRLWQVGLPSPHLWFFDAQGLARLGARHGLEVVSTDSLDSVRRHGLWQRAHSDRKPGVTSVLGVAVVWLAAPVFNARVASDIMHVIFRKPGAASTAAPTSQSSEALEHRP